jgi:hypothetical protein
LWWVLALGRVLALRWVLALRRTLALGCVGVLHLWAFRPFAGGGRLTGGATSASWRE